MKAAEKYNVDPMLALAAQMAALIKRISELSINVTSFKSREGYGSQFSIHFSPQEVECRSQEIFGLPSSIKWFSRSFKLRYEVGS